MNPSHLKNDPHTVTHPGAVMPTNWRWFTRVFAAYSEWMLRRNFHTVRLLGQCNLELLRGRPVVIYANHPSWWDPLVGVFIWRRFFSDRTLCAPIAAGALERYGFFRKLGFYGVERDSARGARNFLQVSRELLSRSDTLLMLTPQGRFADVRESSLNFEPGLAHLARLDTDTMFVPMAVEYAWWEERRPEVLLRMAIPMSLDHTAKRRPVRELKQRLETELDAARRRLAEASIKREVEAFEVLLGGRQGTNMAYDGWRWSKAALRGRQFRPAHGTK